MSLRLGGGERKPLPTPLRSSRFMVTLSWFWGVFRGSALPFFLIIIIIFCRPLVSQAWGCLCAEGRRMPPSRREQVLSSETLLAHVLLSLLQK